MYKCNHCNITIPDNQKEGRVVEVGPKDNPKFYCRECGEPVVYIQDTPQAAGVIHGAQATLISNSDNRITTNNYYGGGTPDEQIETPYGPCRKSEARLCKQCRQWVPLAYFNKEKCLCSECEIKEARDCYEEGKSLFEIGLFDDAIKCFLKFEEICPKDELAEVKTMIGRCYYEQKDYKQALKYFVVASRSNFESQFYMGLCYYYGYGVTKDCVKAMSFFRNANKNNNVEIKEFIDNLNLIRYKDYLEMYGFKNEEGDIVLPCEWKYASGFIEGRVLVQDNYEKYGFMDKTGTVVVACDWENAWSFCEGLARVKDINGQYGFIDKFGKTVIPCEWKMAHDFDHDVAIVQFNDESLGIINKNGNAVSNGWKEMTRYGAGLFGVKNSNDKWGFMDRNGKIIIPFQWIDVKPFSQGLASVQDFNGMWGFVNNLGENVIPCQWKKVLSFSQGLAGVQDFNGMWGYINNLGKVVIPCQWVKVEDFDKDGKAWVKDGWAAFHGHHINKEGNKYYV